MCSLYIKYAFSDYLPVSCEKKAYIFSRTLHLLNWKVEACTITIHLNNLVQTTLMHYTITRRNIQSLKT